MKVISEEAIAAVAPRQWSYLAMCLVKHSVDMRSLAQSLRMGEPLTTEEEDTKILEALEDLLTEINKFFGPVALHSAPSTIWGYEWRNY